MNHVLIPTVYDSKLLYNKCCQYLMKFAKHKVFTTNKFYKGSYRYAFPDNHLKLFINYGFGIVNEIYYFLNIIIGSKSQNLQLFYRLAV